MSREYSTFDIVKGLGIPRERLREWMTRGFVSPSIAEADGAGTKALFSRFDLYLVATFRQLIDEEGLNLPRIKASNILGEWQDKTKRLASQLDDQQLKAAMSRCEVMIIQQQGNEFKLFFEKASIELMRQDMLTKFSADFVDKELSKFDWVGERVEKPTSRNALQDWEWDSVLHINFKKIAATVDAAFPC